MSLESATYVSELSASNPAASDVRAQGDDHLRLIKSTLQATFPNASKAFRLPTTTSLQTATVNVAASDDGKTIPMNAEAAARTVNLPAGSGVPDGFRVSIVKADHSNNTVTIDGNGTETINGALTITLWQRYQRAVVEWSSSLSAWLAHVEYIPPIGEVTPWTGASACPAGWLFPNGTTIGDASSGAAQRADADCRGLFYHCWAEFSNTVCAVSGGRGASATADFDAHKTLALPNLAGNTWIGLDTLGGISDAGRLTASANGANTAGATNGEQIGSESCTLTEAQLAVHDHDPGELTVTGGDHGHPFRVTPNGAGGDADGGLVPDNGGSATNYPAFTGTPSNTNGEQIGGSGNLTLVVGGSTADAGSGTAHANVQPSFVSAWKIKL